MNISYINGLTALAGGGQTGATPIRKTLNCFTTVDTTGDSCLLPAATPGLEYRIINGGVNSMNV